MGTAFKIDPANFTPLEQPAQQQPSGFKIDPANFTPAPEPVGGYKIDPANFTPQDAPQGVDPGDRVVDLSQVQLAPPAPVAVPEYGLDSPLRNFEPEFGNEVTRVAGQLGVTPDDLLAVMDFETGGTMNPAELNKAGSGATGLIQFMPETAKGLGTTTEDLAKMTRTQQMAYVEKYLAPFKGKIKSRDDLYLSILNPGSIGAAPEAPMATNGVEWREGTKFYSQNKGLDKDGKGYITVADATSRVSDSKPGLLERFLTATGSMGSPGQMPPEAYRAMDSRREQATFDARTAGTSRNLWESAGDAAMSAVPFAGGLADAAGAQRLQEAAERARTGQETPDDLQVLREYFADANRGSTFPADLAAGVGGSLRLMGNALAGGVVGGPAGAFAAMATDPGDVQRRMAELQTPGIEFETDPQGQPTGRIILSPAADNTAASAALRTAALQGTDAAIEMLGGKVVSKGLGLAAKGAGKLASKVAPGTTEAIRGVAGRVAGSAPVRLAQAAQIQGMAPEYAEEIAQSAAAQALGEPGADPMPLLDYTSDEAKLTAATVALLGGAPKLAALPFALREGKPEGDPVFTEEAERLRAARQQGQQGQQGPPPGEDPQTPPPGGPGGTGGQQGEPGAQQTEEPQPRDYTSEDPQTVALRLGALGVVPPSGATEEDRLALLKQSEAALLAQWQSEDEGGATAAPAGSAPAQPTQNSDDASNLDSVLASFPDMTVSVSGLIGTNNFTSDELSALESKGLIEAGVLEDGKLHQGVNPEKLWPLREAAQQKRKDVQPNVPQEEIARGTERRAQNYDRLADEQEALRELGDQEKAAEYRAKAAAIRASIKQSAPAPAPAPTPALPLAPLRQRRQNHMSGLSDEQLDAMRLLYSGRLQEGDARAQEVLDDIETVRPSESAAAEPAPTSTWSPDAQAVINLYGSREKALEIIESQIERLAMQRENITPAMKSLKQELEGGNQGDMFGAPEEEEWLFDRGPGAMNSPRPDAPKQPRQEDPQDTGDNADASYARGYGQREQRASRAGEPGRIQLPELTRLARELLGGKYPGVVRKIRAIKGMNPRGVFRSGGKSPDIELRSDIFIGEELAAQQFRGRPSGRVMETLREETIKDLGLEDQADDVVVKAARDGKKWTARVYMRDHNLAERVLAHEIGHLVDYIPDGDMARGNLLGRIASLKNYMKSTIADTPDNPEKPISDEEIAAWRKESEEPVEEWVDVVRVIEEAIPGEATVTPDDIKAIWNNLGGSTVPGLEDYIKSLGDKDRVRVAKEAMKGIVSDLLNRFKPKAGSKRTEVTGRERVTRMPSNAEIVRRLREKIKEEIKRRKLIEDEVVRRELRALTEWWKPIPPDASDGFKQYRYSGKELYADWISVLFNAPSQAAQRAPVTYAAWFAYLRNKPKVQALYDQIQSELDAGATPEIRLDEYRDMLRRGEKRFQDIADKRNKQEALTPRNVMDWLTKTFASRAVVLPEQAREAAKQLDYMPATVVQMFRDMDGGVLNILRENGLTEEDLGVYMGLRRAANERADMANPLGQRGSYADDSLQELRRQVGEERWPKLEEAATAFWNLRQKYIIPRLSASRMWNDTLMEKIRNNEEYAKYTVQEFVSEFLDGNGGAWIFEQQGTLKEIANPFTETVKKDISLLRAVYLNEAKQAAATFSGAAVAKTRWDGKRQAPVPPQDPKQGLLTVQRDGKIKGYYVPVEVAEFFARDPNRAVMGFRIINALGLSNIARRVYVANNPLFGLHNLQRDLRALYQNLPGNPVTQPASIIKAYYQTARDAWMDAFMDKSTPFVEELYKANVLIAGRAAFGAQDFNDSATELDRLMRRYDSAPAAGMQSWRRVGKWVFQDFNQFMERWSKFAGAKYLTNQGRDLGDAKVRDMIRTRAGSPDFMERGAATPWVNQILLFSNAGVQGLRASKKAAMESPGQYAVKMVVANVLPKALMAAMLAGLFDWLTGDDDEPVKKLMERIPENDRLNYTTLPMGATEDGKTVYLIQPHDFTGQMLGRLVTKIFEGNVSPSDFGQAIGGMAPYSVNQLAPGFELLHDLAMMVMGQNPYDYFRGEQKIPKTTFEAGGVEMWQEYGKQAWNSLFGSIVAQVDSGKDFGDSTVGKLAGTPFVGPAMRRFIRVSDRGLDDKYRNAVETAETQEARISLQIGQFVEGEIERYEGGSLPGDAVLRRHANEAYRRAQKEGDVLDKNYQRSAFVQRYVRAAVFAHGDPKRKATAAAGRLGREALGGME